MCPSPHVSVRIDLERVAANAQAIRQRAGVPVIAVVKADAYGLGIERIARAVADIVDRFCVFSLAEAAEAGLFKAFGKPVLVLCPAASATASDFVTQGARPAVWDEASAGAWRDARPILSVDTGMQRFSCAAEEIEAVLKAGGCDEAFTHAIRRGQVDQFLSLVGGRGLKLHAAGSSLLEEPLARLDAVRPGLAIYRGAARVATMLREVRDTRGPAGYSGFAARRHGVIPAGYANGLAVGPCLINGRISRVVEVGMQSAYVECAVADKPGDEVVLLGDIITEAEIALAWGSSPQEVLVRLCAAGVRDYV